MENTYLLCGSNQNDRWDNIVQARTQIAARVGTIVATSAIYETAPWGESKQDDFLNQVIAVRHSLSPEALLQELKSIEQALGRTTTYQWGPRIIDIDILLIGDLIYDSDSLHIPQRQLENRRFALAPLAEIAPEAYHPLLKKTVKELLELCTDQLEVRRLMVTDAV